MACPIMIMNLLFANLEMGAKWQGGAKCLAFFVSTPGKEPSLTVLKPINCALYQPTYLSFECCRLMINEHKQPNIGFFR